MGEAVRFEGRELARRVDSATPGDLLQDSVYFLVTFSDQERLTPTLEPVRFVGQRRCNDGASGLFFEGVGPYGLKWGSASIGPNDAEVPLTIAENDLGDLFKFEGALELMMQCSLRRLAATTEARMKAGSWFAGRDLQAQPRLIAPQLLDEGSIYFSVVFTDQAMLIPAMKPFVFVGKNLESGVFGELYFQDLPSYLEGRRLGSPANGPSGFILLEPEEKPRIFDYEGGLDELLWCSLRRSA
jgi:hypothetical protein